MTDPDIILTDEQLSVMQMFATMTDFTHTQEATRFPDETRAVFDQLTDFGLLTRTNLNNGRGGVKYERTEAGRVAGWEAKRECFRRGGPPWNFKISTGGEE